LGPYIRSQVLIFESKTFRTFYDQCDSVTADISLSVLDAGEHHTVYHATEPTPETLYQDADATRDKEFATNVNRLLADPEAVPIWNAPGYTPEATVEQPAASSSNQPVPGPSTHQPTPEELTQVRELIASMGGQPQGGRPGLCYFQDLFIIFSE
jgi:hypothetical protein